MADPRQNANESEAVRAAVGKSRKLAARVPRLILEARRVAATVIHGLHGRRRAGPGENFWQYRRFLNGEPAVNVDWRRSARDDHLYVREREWEASHTIWLWPDRSASMDFNSHLTEWTKLERALVVSFAMAEVLVQGGERVGIPELMRPTANRNIIEKMAQTIVHDPNERASLPPNFAPAPFSEVLLLSDFWSPIADFRKMIGLLAANGARGHVVQVVDPAEESFPYAGRVEFIESEGLGSITAGRAETWRKDYQSLLANHRAALRAECEHFGWTFTVHRTDRGPTELLFAIHARMGQGAHVTVKAAQPARTGMAAPI
ncbi:MAG: DUF58 domain-containing protein [Pseudolabrys sp.]|nr:DUF58 domain-containing protein [Pseudolabrys sp.]MBV9953743.1 DUF58 domain-containing protein [Pseudolabrys sp.]